ncbi:MAG: metallophosphoesterase [Bacteroidota bacterium]
MQVFSGLLRLLFPLTLMVILELQVFQLVERLSNELAGTMQSWGTWIYYSIPLLALIPVLIRRLNNQIPIFASFSRTILVGFLLSHFLMMPFLILASLLELLGWGSGSVRFWFDVIAFGFGSLIFLLLVLGTWRNRYNYRVHRVDVPIKNLPAGLQNFKIVQISDIHSGSFSAGHQIEKGIKLINNEKADLICFTGDLVNSKAIEIEPYIPIFRALKARFGIYSILGNHDYGDYTYWPDREAKAANFRRLLENHASMGWKLLRNQHQHIQVGDAQLTIVGVENYSASGRFHRYGDLAEATKNLHESHVQVLLSHDPSHWEDQVIPDYPAIDLTLSGHTHGFQFGFEWSKKIRWSPAKWAYKQWAGLYREGQQFLYVNRGFGFLGYHGRVGILPEITVLQLIPA